MNNMSQELTYCFLNHTIFINDEKKASSFLANSLQNVLGGHLNGTVLSSGPFM